MAIDNQTYVNELLARSLVSGTKTATTSSEGSRNAYGKKQEEISKRSSAVFSSQNTGGFLTDAAGKLTRSPLGESPVMVNSAFEVSAPPASQIGSNDTGKFVSSVEELEYDMGSAERPISELIVHWSETFANANLSGEQLDELTGAGSSAFHYIIRRDGSVERGVSVAQAGSHTEGHNKYSIGVCLVGGVLPANEEQVISSVNEKMSASTITRSQYNTLYQIFRVFFSQYPGGQALGYDEIDVTAEGPGFEVRDYVRNLFGKESLYEDPSTETEKSPDDVLDN